MNVAGVRVRVGRSADLDAIVELERASASAPHWAASVYAGILEEETANAHRCLFVAERDEGVVGFAVGMTGSDGVGELESVVVEGAAKRAGIGRALCGAVIEGCREQGVVEVRLEVRVGSAGAIALYEGLGFRKVGRRPSYYSDPEEDAVLMRLKLQ